MQFWVGGYSAERGGSATGIGVLDVGDPASSSPWGELRWHDTPAAGLTSPSWLAVHPNGHVVYAACESDGKVVALKRTGQSSLAAIGSLDVGKLVCHLAVSANGSRLIASCWGDGVVASVRLREDGSLGEITQLAASNDPYRVEDEVTLFGLSAAAVTSNERVSRAHQALFLPDGVLLTVDMGLDLLRFWRGATLIQEVVLPAGTGPRHAVLHPSGYLYVLTELSKELFVLGKSRDGAWQIVSATALAPNVGGDGDTAGEITVSADGAYVYCGIRGMDSIAVLAVRGEGDRLEHRALVESGVERVRFHANAAAALFAAGQRSDTVARLTIDQRTGIPGPAKDVVSVPAPVVLVPSPLV